MIVTDPDAFLAAWSRERFPLRGPATARGAFLVTPASEALARESARDNRYMDLAKAPDARRAQAQHVALQRRLASDVPIVQFAGDPSHPDGMFPNNVFATTRGQLLIGSMRHPVRQAEAGRDDIRGWFRGVLGYRETDLSRLPCVAELTGALCIDRARGIGYCGLSERCDLAGACAMHAAFGLRLTFAFELAEGEYHANVVLAILAGRAALVAPDGFRDARAAAAISSVYHGHVIELEPLQKAAFAANAIALAPDRAWFSTTAADALHPAQRAHLERSGFAIGTAELDEVEKAGGSLRCCVAEIY